MQYSGCTSKHEDLGRNKCLPGGTQNVSSLKAVVTATWSADLLQIDQRALSICFNWFIILPLKVKRLCLLFFFS